MVASDSFQVANYLEIGFLFIEESTTEIMFLGIIILTIFSWYRIFWRTFDKVEDFSDYGFDQVTTCGKNVKHLAKKVVINQMMHRRKIGNIPPVFPNGWFVILDSDKLKRGQSQELYVLGENLVIWRGASGNVYVADAYCPHLGAHLGVGGQVTEDCITCPFHGWAFDGAEGGALANIPYSNFSTLSNEFPSVDSTKLKMKLTVEHCGWIYMYYNAEGLAPKWYPEEISEIQSGQWKYRGRSEFLVTAILQDIQENGADSSHFNYLHEPSCFAGATPWLYWWRTCITRYVFATEWNADENIKHQAAFEMTARVRLFNYLTIFKMSVRVVQIGPATARMEIDTIIGKGILMISITPVEPLLQKISHRIYTSATFLSPLARWFLTMYDVMLCRDIVVWNRKTYLPNPVLMKEDSTIKSYRKWFSQYYSENSPRYAEIKKTLEF